MIDTFLWIKRICEILSSITYLNKVTYFISHCHYSIYNLLQHCSEGRSRCSAVGRHGRRGKTCSVEDRKDRAFALRCNRLWSLREENCQLFGAKLFHHEIHRAGHRFQHQLYAALLQGLLLQAMINKLTLRLITRHY